MLLCRWVDVVGDIDPFLDVLHLLPPRVLPRLLDLRVGAGLGQVEEHKERLEDSST